MRHAATKALLERNDVLVVASVSCIYGLGSPASYFDMLVFLERDDTVERDAVLRKLVDMQYQRNDYDFHRGTFRVRGDVVEIFPAYEEGARHPRRVLRRHRRVDRRDRPAARQGAARLERVAIYPASHYVATAPTAQEGGRRHPARAEGAPERAARSGRKLLEAQRLEQRTLYDLELLAEMGFCPGIENYSRHLDGREPGEPPYTLIDYFPDDFLLVIDESHVTVPQIGGMYRGDRSRKETLVEFGFRLPSALDNRPLNFEEFLARIPQALYVSATPGDWELRTASGRVVEQLIRPTGLMDPEIIVRPARHQVDDLLDEIRARVAERERVLVTTLTKKMAEDLTDYLQEIGIRVRYIHADIDTIERIEIIRDLRKGTFDVLVGINLLREGLDLPEVSLVAILDADKEGYLRSERSLIQTIGRAARNVSGTVLMYADTDHRIDAQSDRRDQSPARGAGGVQRGARHHAADDREGHRRSAGRRLRRRLRHRARRRRGSRGRRTCGPGGAREADRGPPGGDARGGEAARVRAGGRPPRRDPRPRGAPAGRRGGDGARLTTAPLHVEHRRATIRRRRLAGASRPPRDPARMSTAW